VLAFGVTAAVVGAGWSFASADEPGAAITLVAEPHPTADLFPGGAGAAQFTIDNPGDAAVQLVSVSFGAASSSDPGRCGANYLTVSRTLPLSVRVPEHAQAVAQSVPGAFQLSDDAPDGCQGVTFTVDTTVKGVPEGSAELPDTGVNAVGLGLVAVSLLGVGVALSRIASHRGRMS
jgi:hypothetical protein